MGQIWDETWDDAGALFAFLMTMALLIYVSLIAAVIWYLITVAITQYRYRQHQIQGEADFDEIAAQLGINFDPDDLLRALYGAGIDLPNEGYRTVADWMAGTVFGVEDVEEAA